jgi:hypothetical protein
MRIREKMPCIAVLYTLVTIHIAFAQAPCLGISIAEKIYKDTRVTLIAAPNWGIGFMSQPKYGLTVVQVQDKALFMAQAEVEIYDFTQNEWTVSEMINPRRMKVAATGGQYVYFAGGSTGPMSAPEYSSLVDIYDNTTGKWSVSKLCGARAVGASGAGGNKVLFAGGIGRNGYSARVDIFDTETNRRTTASLSQARSSMAASTVGNEILFAGGEAYFNHQQISSNRVDIYNTVTGVWCEHYLSASRYNIAAITVGSCVLFAGGLSISGGQSKPSASIDIYNADTGQWTVTRLSQPKYNITTIAANGKAYFVGGILDTLGTLSDKVEIYDEATASWSYTTLTEARAGMGTGFTNTRLMFAGGYAGTYNESNITDRVDVLNLATGQWTVERLHQSMFGISTASYNGKVLFLGGACVSKPYPHCTQNPGEIDIWVDVNKEYPFPSSIDTANRQLIAISAAIKTKPNSRILFVNPSVDATLSLDLSGYRFKTVQITLLDKQRHSVLCTDAFPFESITEEINVATLPDGYYWVVIESEGRKSDVRMLLVKR